MTDTRPNIFVIVSHDIGRHLGCYGVPQAGTPHLDRFATEGVRFDRFYSTSPQCSPARASLFTGRFPHSHGVIGICAPTFDFDLHPEERHLSHLLHDCGYDTALAGFQHETLRLHDLPFERLPGKDSSCDSVADSIIAYLRSRKACNKPFFLQAGWSQAHRPFEKFGTSSYSEGGVFIPPWIADEPSAREDFAAFQGALHRLDGAMGRILEVFEQTGLEENTIVIFVGDHGIPFARAKHSLYEPGCEIAALVRWPVGGWAGGRIVSEMLSGVDLLPTLLDAVDQPVPLSVQGRSFRGLLDGAAYEPTHAIFTEQNFNAYPDVSRAVRTERLKLIANFTPGRAFYDSSQLWRPLSSVSFIEDQPRTRHLPFEFYDLENDPLEQFNLLDDSTYCDEVAHLKSQLYKWMNLTDDPLLRGLPEPPIYRRTLDALVNSSDLT